MSALFQSVASQLGNLGGSYATARDTQTESRNQAAVQQFDMAQKLRDYLEQQKMDDLAAQVQRANLARQQAGTWKAYGDPLKGADGNYAIPEINDATGDLRFRSLGPDFQPESKFQDDLASLEKAYGKPLPQAWKDAYIEGKMGLPKPSYEAMALGVDAWQREHPGQQPTLKDIHNIAEMVRPKTDTGAESPDDIPELALMASQRGDLLKTLPSKVRTSVLDYILKNHLPLPNDLPAGVEINLEGRANALSRGIDLIDSITPNLKYLKSLPTASLVQIAKSPDSIEGIVPRMMGSLFNTQDQMNINMLIADLKSFNEALNAIRSPLGATTFRGKEGLQMLLGNTVTPLTTPGINERTMSNTRATFEAFLNGTDINGKHVPGILDTLAGTYSLNPATGSGPATSTSTPPPGAIVKAYNPATGKVE